MPIKMIFHKGGRVTQQPYGYQGNGCHAATQVYDNVRSGHRVVSEGQHPSLAVEETAQSHEDVQQQRA